MESRNIVCSEHTAAILFVSIYLTIGIITIFAVLNKIPIRKEWEKVLLIIMLVFLICCATLCWMQYINKKLILTGNEVLCINSFGQERTYTLNRIKKVKIDDSVSFRHVKIIFDDGYSYTVNGIATNYSELESIAKKEWQKLH